MTLILTMIMITFVIRCVFLCRLLIYKFSDKSNSPHGSISMMDVRLARVDNIVTVVTSSGGQNVVNIHQNSAGDIDGGPQQPSPTPGGSRSADVHMGGGGINNNNSDNRNNISSLTLAGVVGSAAAATVVSIKQESLTSIDSLVSGGGGGGGGGFVDSTTFLHSPVGQIITGNLSVHNVDGGESMHDDGCGQGEHIPFFSILSIFSNYIIKCRVRGFFFAPWISACLIY